VVARAAFALTIKPDKINEYIEAHRHVWPELREAIRAAGIRNYSIFVFGKIAFGYLESDDFEHAWASLAAQDVNRRWQDAMADLLEARVAQQGPAMLPEIFRLDEPDEAGL
jgi:L-rhamnose mutarotase